MGRHFGELIKVNRLIQYSLSPFEQKAFAGVIDKGIPNMWRRFRGQVFRVVPPFVFGYLIYDWGTKENTRIFRKNPDDFENDE